MKVRAIEPYQKDGANRWRVRFEESNDPLITARDPKVKPGDDIAESKLTRIEKGEYAYYVWASDTPQKKAFEKSPRETAAIQAQVAVKILSDLFVAGKLKELEGSQEGLAVNLREWLKAALVHDPLMQKILETK